MIVFSTIVWIYIYIYIYMYRFGTVLTQEIVENYVRN